ncbi:hypothetical protein AGIG_G20531 [Arapaima gigas]
MPLQRPVPKSRGTKRCASCSPASLDLEGFAVENGTTYYTFLKYLLHSFLCPGVTETSGAQWLRPLACSCASKPSWCTEFEGILCTWMFFYRPNYPSTDFPQCTCCTPSFSSGRCLRGVTSFLHRHGAAPAGSFCGTGAIGGGTVVPEKSLFGENV